MRLGCVVSDRGCGRRIALRSCLSASSLPSAAAAPPLRPRGDCGCGVRSDTVRWSGFRSDCVRWSAVCGGTQSSFARRIGLRSDRPASPLRVSSQSITTMLAFHSTRGFNPSEPDSKVINNNVPHSASCSFSSSDSSSSAISASHLSSPPSSFSPPHSSTPLPAVALKWLSLNRSYHMEYQGYLANHLSHAAAVLGWMGCDHHLIDSYCSHIAHHVLEPAHPSRNRITLSNWRDHFSDMSYYPDYLSFFDEEVKRLGGGDQAVSVYFPLLMSGMHGSALHPLIQVGMGVEAHHGGMIAEGLAYLCAEALPFAQVCPIGVDPTSPSSIDAKEAFVPTEKPLMTVTEAVSYVVKTVQTSDLMSKAVAEKDRREKIAHINLSTFQKISRVYADGAVGTDAIFQFELKFEDNGGLTLSEVVRQISYLVAHAYEHSTNDFFVVHGNTSWHSLQQCLPLLTPAQQRKAVDFWLKFYLSAFAAQGMPGVEKVVTVLPSISTPFLSDSVPSSIISQADWDKLIHREWMGIDEHVPKLIFTLWTDWLKYDHDPFFYHVAQVADKNGDTYRF